MAIAGTYYALNPKAGTHRMAWAHYILAVAGTALLIPGIAVSIRGGSPALAQAGGPLVLLSMLVFLWNLLRFGLGSEARRDATASRPATIMPAA